MLLRSFGSIDAIRRATPEELAAVPTMTLAIAKKVANFLTEDP
jgi:excinuclease UvrABC nuclease subunit